MSSGPSVLPWEWTQAGEQEAPFDYQVPPGQEVQPYTATATYDGTGASGDFVPTISIYSQSGNLLARVFPPETVPMGGVAGVTFLPPFGSAASGSTAGNKYDGTYAYYTGSITVPAAGGGGPGKVNFDFDTNFAGGTQLLDVTQPTSPSVKTAGLYAWTASIFSTDAPQALLVPFLLGINTAAGNSIVRGSTLNMGRDASLSDFLNVASLGGTVPQDPADPFLTLSTYNTDTGGTHAFEISVYLERLGPFQ